MCNQCNEDTLRRTRKQGVQQYTGLKTCSKCGKEKYAPLNFNKRVPKAHLNKHANLYYSECKECKLNRSRVAYDTCKGRATELRSNGRKRSAKLGLPFDLEFDWLLSILEEGVCQVTGIPFELSGGKVHKGNRPFTPSLDRTDPTKGYTMDNVKVVCWIYNGAKGVGTHEDVIKLAEALINVK